MLLKLAERQKYNFHVNGPHLLPKLSDLNTVKNRATQVLINVLKIECSEKHFCSNRRTISAGIRCLWVYEKAEALEWNP